MGLDLPIQTERGRGTRRVEKYNANSANPGLHAQTRRATNCNTTNQTTHYTVSEIPWTNDRNALTVLVMSHLDHHSIATCQLPFATSPNPRDF